MHDQPKPNSTPKSKTWLKPLTILLIVGTACWALIYFFTPLRFFIDAAFTPNYAEEVVKPIEKALQEKGAIKKCERGDKGVGPDNAQPWYGATFELARSEEDTIELLKKIVRENGFDFNVSAHDVGNIQYQSVGNAGSDRFKNRKSILSFGIEANMVYDPSSPYCTLQDKADKSSDLTTFSIGARFE